MSFTVAIVGRPNVGKSTFFNRLLEERKAIVDDISGVTRDRQYGVAEWNGKTFNVIDTGGFVPRSEDVFEREIRKQVVIALEEADAVVFMVDVATGITDLDDAMASMLRRTAKPVFLVVNKVDNHERLLEASEFYSLGFEQIYFLSSISGSGTGELLDDLCKLIKAEEVQLTETELPRFAIIGQPNVGKSSLLNALVGKERTIVSDIAGTTRDTIHTHYNLFNKEFILIDTAGIRRKAKVNEDLEFYSVMRTIKAIETSDVCILMLDAQSAMEAQDLSILSLIEQNRKGLVIAVNKWDLVEKDTQTALEYEARIRERIAPFRDIPIVFISVHDKQRILKIVETAMHVFTCMKQVIPTRKLNDIMLPIIEQRPPQSHKGKHVKIKFITQIKGEALFLFYCNLPQYVNESYKRFLENQIREQFDFSGVPVVISMRKKS